MKQFIKITTQARREVTLCVPIDRVLFEFYDDGAVFATFANTSWATARLMQSASQIELMLQFLADNPQCAVADYKQFMN